MTARALLAVLTRAPLGYGVRRQRGSHRILVAPGRPRIVFAFHDRQTLAPGLVRKIWSMMWDLRRTRRLTYCEPSMETIRVIHHTEEGTWWAESPDVPRWSAAGDTFEETRRLAEEGVRFALERDDLVVEHFWPVAPTAPGSPGE